MSCATAHAASSWVLLGRATYAHFAADRLPLAHRREHPGGHDSTVRQDCEW